MFPPFKNHSESRDLATASFGQECARLGLMDSKDHVDLHQSPRCFLHFISFRVFRIMNFPKPTFFIVSQQKNVFFFFRLLQCTARKSLILSTLIFYSVMVKGSDYVGFEGGAGRTPKFSLLLKSNQFLAHFSCYRMLHHVSLPSNIAAGFGQSLRRIVVPDGAARRTGTRPFLQDIKSASECLDLNMQEEDLSEVSTGKGWRSGTVVPVNQKELDMWMGGIDGNFVKTND